MPVARNIFESRISSILSWLIAYYLLGANLDAFRREDRFPIFLFSSRSNEKTFSQSPRSVCPSPEERSIDRSIEDNGGRSGGLALRHETKVSSVLISRKKDGYTRANFFSTSFPSSTRSSIGAIRIDDRFSPLSV